MSRREVLWTGAAALAIVATGQQIVAAPATQPTTIPADAPNVVWKSASDFVIEGRGFADTQSLFDRLPIRAKERVRQAVWDLSRNSAGLHIRFASNAPTIHVRYELTSAALAMPHMPATGMSGVDLYAKDATGQWRWMDVTKPAKQMVQAELCKGSDPGQREYLLYLPLYNGVKSLDIGVADGFELTPAAAQSKKPTVYYGTSIAQGGCASRPGMAHVSIIGRMLDRPMINLGFSGNGWMDLEVAELISEIDADAYVIDCLPNCNLKQVEERTEPLIKRIANARPGKPILMVSDPAWCHSPWSSSLRKTQAERRAAYEKIVESMAKDLPQVHTLDIANVFADDFEGTVDGVHPNDLGMMQLARRIGPAIGSLLKAQN